MSIRVSGIRGDGLELASSLAAVGLAARRQTHQRRWVCFGHSAVTPLPSFSESRGAEIPIA
jgi:hypothetical protein